MNIFILGSVAFDEINFFPGHFKDVIKKEFLDKLSVSFIVEKKGHFFGGCAGNICYNLGLLKCSAYICSLVGEDGDTYLNRLKDSGIYTKYLYNVLGYTAKANIISDAEGNQIASFAPGVIGPQADDFILPENALPEDIILIGPENPNRMKTAFKQSLEKKLKIFFDPGQLIHAFNKDELNNFLESSYALCANGYEWELLKSISEKTETEIVNKVPLVLVTDGENGVKVFQNGELNIFPAYNAKTFVDPTGAGDAFRAGLLSGLKQGLSLENSVKIGTIMGALVVEHKETQGHIIDFEIKQEIEKLGYSF